VATNSSAADRKKCTAIVTCRVVAQLIQNLVHFEHCQNMLDEHRGTDAALGNAQFVLGIDKDVVPQAGLEVALQFVQIDVRPTTALEQFFCVVEQVQPKVKDAARHRFAVVGDMLFVQMPATDTHRQHCRLVVEAIDRAVFGGERNRTADGVAQIDLTLHDVVPQRRIGVFEVRHKDLGARVEGVDDHLAVDGAGDFGAAIAEVRWDWCDLPIVGPDVCGLGVEIGQHPCFELVPARNAPCQECTAALFVALDQILDKSQRLTRQNLVVARLHRPSND